MLLVRAGWGSADELAGRRREVEDAVVDYGPGVLPIPDRFRRQHTFVGVDYDLDVELYESLAR